MSRGSSGWATSDIPQEKVKSKSLGVPLDKNEGVVKA